MKGLFTLVVATLWFVMGSTFQHFIQSGASWWQGMSYGIGVCIILAVTYFLVEFER